MKRIELTTIDFTLNYKGYLWLSDSKKPLVFLNDKIPQNIFTSLPFVIEGYLYCESRNRLSIKISHFDGSYHIYAVELNHVSKDRLTPNSFVAKNFHNEIKFIETVQFWDSIPDENCENMNVLEPSWVAFTGFN